VLALLLAAAFARRFTGGRTVAAES
jgi:hypothetical protein